MIYIFFMPEEIENDQFPFFFVWILCLKYQSSFPSIHLIICLFWDVNHLFQIKKYHFLKDSQDKSLATVTMGERLFKNRTHLEAKVIVKLDLRDRNCVSSVNRSLGK